MTVAGEIISKIKESAGTKEVFISEVRKVILQQDNLKNIVEILDLIFRQNFNLQEFNISDINVEDSIVSIINREPLSSDLWCYLQDHPYLLSAPDPELPEPFAQTSVSQPPLIGSDPGPDS